MKTEKATVKRYQLKRKKPNNPEEYTITENARINLSKYSEFQDKEEVYILTKEDYENLIHNNNEEQKKIIKEKDDEIAVLKQKIKDLEEGENQTTNAINRTKLLNLLDHINDRNKNLMNLKDNYTNTIENIIEETLKYAEESNKNNQKLLDTTIEEDNKEITKKHDYFLKELDKAIDEANNKIENAGILTRILNKNELKLNINTKNLKPTKIKPIEHKKLEIDSKQIKNNALKNVNFNKLWIDTNMKEIESNKEIIIQNKNE